MKAKIEPEWQIRYQAAIFNTFSDRPKIRF